MELQAVVFDVGEVLVDETRAWSLWADWLEVPRATFFAALGAVIARGEHHHRVFDLVRPDLAPFEIGDARAARLAAGHADDAFVPEDLYPDVVPCFAALRARGYVIGVAGNQPERTKDALRAGGVRADFVASSEGWGIEKPAPEFFARVVEAAGTRSQVTDWPTAKTPWLALDRDGNGHIDDGSELFGSMTRLSIGRRASNGFSALRELDADHDGRITPADPGFAHLLVWADRNGDRRSSADELDPLSAYGVVSIDLSYAVEPRCDGRGNCEVERASFRFVDSDAIERVGAVVDVHLAAQR